MRTWLIIILTLFLAALAARAEPSRGEDFACKAIGQTDGIEMKVESRASDAQRLRKKYSALAYSAEEIEAAIQKQARSFAVITIHRRTIEGANLKNFAFVIMDEDGTVLSRRAGEHDVPEMPNRDRMWWNISVQSFPDDFKKFITFRVVDLLHTTQSDFVIYRPEIMNPESKAPVSDSSPIAAADSQQQALVRYPALKVVGSPMHREFVKRFEAYQRGRHSLLQQPDWPLRIADEAAAVLLNNGNDSLVPSAARSR